MTDKQRRMFFREWNKARKAMIARDPSLEMLSAEQWREKRIEMQAKALRVPEHSETASGRFTLSSKHLNEREIDLCIGKWKELQNNDDFDSQVRQARQPVFRIRYLCINAVHQIWRAKGEEIETSAAVKYVDGLARKRFGRELMELPAVDARKVLSMLETHKNRLEKRNNDYGRQGNENAEQGRLQKSAVLH